MSDVSSKAKWFRDERDRRGWSAAEVASRIVLESQKMGMPISLTQQSVSGFENGGTKSVPQWLHFAERIFQETTPSIADALAALTPHQRRFVEMLECAPQERQIAAIEALKGREVSGPDASQFDLVPVASIDMDYGLGATFAVDHVEETLLHFPRAFIESITPSPAVALTWSRGRGDSMYPTIGTGDLILIDRSERTVREPDLIWALTVGEMAMVKRLRVRGEKVMILSDAQHVPADEVHVDEVNIIGRVIFIGRRQ